MARSRVLRGCSLGAASAVAGFGALSSQRAHAWAGASSDVGVTSYNVLSPALAAPDHFFTCNPEDLEPATRLRRVEAKLDAARKAGFGDVIALQEVSLGWSGPLHKFFADRGYQFMCARYGSDFSDHMGVGLAWDPAKVKLEDAQIVKLAATYPDWPEFPKQKKSFLQKLWALCFGEKPAKRSPWEEARWRKNQLILARLRTNEGKAFCVACYHMPCLFGAPEKVQVMNIHAQLAARKLEDYAGGDPYILAGDFNVMPDSSPYALLSEGKLPEDHPERPTHPHGKWEVGVTPLRSAYAVANGEEPTYTNLAESGFSKGVFKGTLDYFWLSSHWKVAETLPLPKEVPSDHTYPSATEPSDHLLIAAKLAL